MSVAELPARESLAQIVADTGVGKGATRIVDAMESLFREQAALSREVFELRHRLRKVELGTQQIVALNRRARAFLDGEPANREQMLGESSPLGWYTLHKHCWSQPIVRRLQEKIVEGCVRQQLFGTSRSLSAASADLAVHRNQAFRPYRLWVWGETGDPNATQPVAGLDPWSYIDGLWELAGPADDPAYRNRFIEILATGGSGYSVHPEGATSLTSIELQSW